MAPVAPDSNVTAPDSATARPRVVRVFPPLEVRALLPDMGSSQTVHSIPSTALHGFPVDNLTDLIALQPGVVADAEELHVRGGRAGETVVSLDGLGLNEPLRRRAPNVPLLALSSAELVSGAPDARYGGGLAGVLELHTIDPGERPEIEWRWQGDGGLDTKYDRVAARAGTPLPLFGLGLVAAGDATFDDTSLPRLRSESRHDLAGIPLGWRAENRIQGFIKLAPVRGPERWSAQLLVSRAVHQPYSPDWSLDGWTYISPNYKDSPIFSPVPLPGYQRFRAADHLAMTDDRQIAALIKLSTLSPRSRASLGLGWLRTRTVTSVGGGQESPEVAHRPRFGKGVDREGFYVLWGDYPLYRESASDVLSLRADSEIKTPGGSGVAAGMGLTYDDVYTREMDWMPIGVRSFEIEGAFQLDSVRAFQAWAPGGYAYLQSRWVRAGMILNLGLRLEYYTAGPQATDQTLPGSARGVWSMGPRLGIAYPISVRDAFSLAYVRLQQAPARDFLYDRRTAISDRQPLGNPALVPATLISYEAAVKHVIGPEWALQASVFYRDVYDQVGALDYQIPQGTMNLRYASSDQSHVSGLEWSLIHARAGRRIEASYTWLNASGNESRPEGDPYGPVRSPNSPPIGDLPLSWDRRHALLVAGTWQLLGRATVSWSTALSSPLPWSPKPRRQIPTDVALTNSRRLSSTETTNLDLRWSPPGWRAVSFGLEARNLFDSHWDRAATVDGYPNPVINTIYDDYGAYRTETGQGGGAYWSALPGDPGHWVPVHDPRLANPPRTLRVSIGGSW